MTLSEIIARETQRFMEAHPKSAAQARSLDAHWLFGAPFHWMKDWAAPVAIVAEDGDGAVLTDPSKPDGTPRKLMDNSRLAAMGWKPTVDLAEGIRRSYAAFLAGEGRNL